jgi:hypothetical protein
MNHGSQISKVEFWTAAKGGHMRWSFDTNEPIVFMMDVTTAGHTIKPTNGARSHHFLLNNRECVVVPYLAPQLSVFCKLD